MSDEATRLKSSESELQQRLSAVYNANSDEDLAQAYDAWAQTYDVDLVQKLHWNAPERTADRLAQHAPVSARVLDVGCGTGLVGEALAALGFRNIDGLDLAPGMLAAAQAKGIYAHFHQMALGPVVDLADDAYDAVIAVGVFTEGHAKPDALPELVRATRPGGHIAFSLRPDVWADLGFRDMQEALVRHGRWVLAEETDFQEGFSAVQTRPYKIWVYRVA
ncbi:MAG: class I SAM-dependent methyltransferase [Candidatus Hydrogenedentes bacterium]|nr:class I SAM-dependent methyltransferase [Candidatus Hydrogenedentota bacterium]